MGTIDLSNTINVSLSATPQGLRDFATNTICIFSNEQPLSAEPYITAVNAQDIINEYGTNSLTAKMGTALFTPVPNLRTGKGQVYVFPYTATNATSATTTTIAITSTIVESLKLITSGDLTIGIDGTDYHVSGLNFGAVSDINDVVKVLVAQNLDCNIEVVNTNQIQFQSRRYGATNSAITLKATTTPIGTDIYGASYLDGANQTTVAGINATGTTLAEAVAQAEQLFYFGVALTTQNCEKDLIFDNATAIQTKDHLYFEAMQSLKDIQSLGTDIKSAGLNHSHILAYSYKGADGAKQAVATYASIACSTNYSATSTALTMNLKELTGILPDLNLNQTYYSQAKANGVDIYGSTEGLGCVYSFSNSKYTDEATMDLWLKKALEVAGFNYLRKTNTKIPQTESGMTGLKQAYANVLEQGIRNGCIAGGKWNDSIPFGDPELFDENITNKGYYIYSIPVAQQSQTERENREAPVVQIAVKRSGSIHSSNVIVNIQA